MLSITPHRALPARAADQRGEIRSGVVSPLLLLRCLTYEAGADPPAPAAAAGVTACMGRPAPKRDADAPAGNRERGK